MKVSDYNIMMYGNSSMLIEHNRKESLRMWMGSRKPESYGLSSSNSFPGYSTDKVNISGSSEIQPERSIDARRDSVTPEDRLKILIVEKMLKMLTGKDIKINIPEVSEDKAEKNVRPEASNLSPVGWGVEYEYAESYSENETLSFNAEGIVKTEDGREINFALELHLKRSYLTENRISLRAGNALNIDPLVINFEDNTIQLTDRRYEFDLNTDGSLDNIPFIHPGSGFLALDLNKDGIINNGLELFGTKSGNGFVDLAEYDEDGNGWIDESDSVFGRLLVWSKDMAGNDLIESVSEKGIGAIYLKSVDVLFHIKDGDNRDKGLVKRVGMFLRNNGSPGSVMQVDLLV